MSIRRFVYVNLVIAGVVLILNSVIVATSGRYLTLRGTALEILRFPLALALAGLPPLQTIASIGLMLFKREATRSQIVWFLLLVIAFSLVSGILVLMGIAQCGPS